jgi:hypothetical protein
MGNRWYLEIEEMQKKKKPEYPKPRNVWEIDPATKIHEDRHREERHKIREKLRRGIWEEIEEE